MKFYKYTTILIITIFGVYFARNTYYKNKYKTKVLKEFKHTYIVLQNPKLVLNEAEIEYDESVITFYEDKEISMEEKSQLLKKYSDRITNEIEKIGINNNIHKLSESREKLFLSKKTLEEVNEAFFEINALWQEAFDLSMHLKYRQYNRLVFNKNRDLEPVVDRLIIGSSFDHLLNYKSQLFTTESAVKWAIIKLENESRHSSKWLDSINAKHKQFN